jgi:hypothetical protein
MPPVPDADHAKPQQPVPDADHVKPQLPDRATPPQGDQNRQAPPPKSSQQFILPFDALGPAETLDKIKVVQIEGKAHFVMAGNVNDVRVPW